MAIIIGKGIPSLLDVSHHHLSTGHILVTWASWAGIFHHTNQVLLSSSRATCLMLVSLLCHLKVLPTTFLLLLLFFFFFPKKTFRNVLILSSSSSSFFRLCFLTFTLWSMLLLHYMIRNLIPTKGITAVTKWQVTKKRDSHSRSDFSVTLSASEST